MKYFITLLLIFCSSFVFSQEILPCGTDSLSKEQEAFLKEFQKNGSQVQSRSATLYLALRIIIVGNNDGTGYVNTGDLLENLCELNKDFAKASIYFYIKEIHYINNTKTYNHGGGLLMYEYDAIDVFLIGNLPGLCGYFSPSMDCIVIANKCIGPSKKTLTHEIGHYLSLPHTFNGWEGRKINNNPLPEINREKVDGSNCLSMGDGFCDTPPDYLSYVWNCSYNVPTLVDPNGDTLILDASNFMSYSFGGCKYRFSGQQIDAMRSYIPQYKYRIIGNSNNGFIPIATPFTITPAIDEKLKSNEVTFRWNKVLNATFYRLELSEYNVMKYKDLDVIVADTFYNFSKLYFNKKYFWRITAISPGNTCEASSSLKSFNTGKEKIGVFPNPASKSEKLNVIVNLERITEGLIEVYSPTGSLLDIKSVRLQRGQNNISIDLSGYSNGMYLIRFNSPEVVISTRILLVD